MEIFVLPWSPDCPDEMETMTFSCEPRFTEIMELLAASKTEASLPSLLL
jgi:hypothetical protein